MASASQHSEKTWHGLAVSSGVAAAVVHVLQDTFDEPPEREIAAADVDAELERFNQALQATKEEIQALQGRITERGGEGEAEIFDTHLMILEDVSILEHVRRTVRNKHRSADAVYFKLMRKHMDALRGVDDPYLRERFIDIKDIIQRVMRHLRGDERSELSFDQPVVIVAHDLTPSDTVQIDRSMVAGFAIETGSANSHAAIIARSLGIPAVVRLHGLCAEVHTGQLVVLDGDDGALIQRPSAETLARYEQIEAESEALEDMLQSVCRQPAITIDGRSIRVGGNAEFVDELGSIIDSGAEEIGLFRTEFMYLEDPDASEDKLADLYTQVVRKVAPRRVVFRTLDLGGDKLDPMLAAEPEPNPFLGWRGIRVSLGRPEFFKRQLRALLRATCCGEVAIMFPMVSGVEEVRAAKALLAECKAELCAEGIHVPERIEIGAMIEIPSAACTADLIAPEVDFFSLGTNDLIQYTIAVDRLNERVADLYQSTHPGVLRLIRMVVEAARRHNVRVAMCGEMAGDIELTPLLIGLGLDELSAATGQVPSVKEAIRKLNHSECYALADAVMNCADAAEIHQRSRIIADRCYCDLMA
jgi:phosphoenolpyruvate-protein phosphotransferase (PTS system enzyme I)